MVSAFTRPTPKVYLMKNAWILISSVLVASSAFAGDECKEMSSTPEIVGCLEYRTQVAEKSMSQTFDELAGLLQKSDVSRVEKLQASQKAWGLLRDANCGLEVSGTDGGEELGITRIGCKLAETLKRAHELEGLLDAQKSGNNKAFSEALDGLVEIRDTDVSPKAIANAHGVWLINREFSAAASALMSAKDIRGNKLRIKSLRMIDEGQTSVCKDASVYLAELGYFAQKTQKYVKVYVLTELNADRSVKRVRTSVQENLHGAPVCP